MTFDDAKDYRLPFGPYMGQSLDQVAETDSGLRYLDRLVDSRLLTPDVRDALDAYLSDKVIQRELEEMADDREDNREEDGE